MFYKQDIGPELLGVKFCVLPARKDPYPQGMR